MGRVKSFEPPSIVLLCHVNNSLIITQRSTTNTNVTEVEDNTRFKLLFAKGEIYSNSMFIFITLPYKFILSANYGFCIF